MHLYLLFRYRALLYQPYVVNFRYGIHGHPIRFIIIYILLRILLSSEYGRAMKNGDKKSSHDDNAINFLCCAFSAEPTWRRHSNQSINLLRPFSVVHYCAVVVNRRAAGAETRA